MHTYYTNSEFTKWERNVCLLAQRFNRKEVATTAHAQIETVNWCIVLPRPFEIIAHVVYKISAAYVIDHKN